MRSVSVQKKRLYEKRYEPMGDEKDDDIHVVD